METLVLIGSLMCLASLELENTYVCEDLEPTKGYSTQIMLDKTDVQELLDEHYGNESYKI